MKTDPEQLGGYWIAGRLGSGGQGVLYEAYDDHGERYALRALRRRPARQRVAAALRVPSFCTARLLAADLDGPTPYLVTEYVPGTSLRVKVGESGPYQGEDLFRLAVGVATALTAVHEAGSAHGALTPDDVLLGPAGPRVIDFGLVPKASQADDVHYWGQILLFASGGALQPSLRELVTRISDKRHSAREVLVKLLDGAAGDPLAEGSRIAAPLRVEVADPSLGVVAEEVYAGLGPAERAAVPGVFLRLVTPGPDSRRIAPLGEFPDGTGQRVISRYGEAGLLQAGPGEERTVMLAHPALVHAWPRLRGWLVPGDGNPAEAGEEPSVREAPPAGRATPVTQVPPVGQEERAVPKTRVIPERAAQDEPGVPKERIAPKEPGVPGVPAAHGTTTAQDTAAPHDTTTAQGTTTPHGTTTAQDTAAPQDTTTAREPAGRGAPAPPQDLRQALARAADGWERGGGRAGDLLRDRRLDEVLGWAGSGGLSRTERAFVDASARLANRRLGRRRVVANLLAVLLAAALAGAGVAVWQGSKAREELVGTTAQALAATVEDVRGFDPVMARRLSAAAWRVAAVPQARSALMASVTDPVRDVFADPDAAADSVYAFDQAGRWLVAVRGGTARVWDPVAKTLLMEIRGAGRSARLAALNPAGTTLAVATTGDVRVFDTRSGVLVRSLPVKAAVALGYQGETLATTDRAGLGALWRPDGSQVMFVPMSTLATDGRRVLAVPVGNSEEPARIWENGSRLDLPWLADGTFGAGALAPDGASVVLSGPAGTRVHDLAGGRVLAGLGPAATSLAFSPDGKLLVTGSPDGATVWRTTDWARLLDAREPNGRAQSAATRPNGTQNLAARTSGTEHAANPAIGKPSAAPGRPGGPRSAVAGPGGLRYVDAGGLAKTYTIPATPATPLGREAAARALSPDGTTLATADGASITLWSLAEARPLATLPSRATLMSFAPDGRRLAVAVPDQPGVDVWDLTQHSRVTTLTTSPVKALAYSPDSRTLAVAAAEWVELHGDRGARRVAGVNGQGLAWRQDGLLLAVYDEDRVYTVDPVEAAPMVPNAGVKAAGVVAFSPDGRTAATGNSLGQITLWDAGLRAPLGPPLVTGDRLESLLFSRDGQVLAAAGGTLTLWDVRTGTRLGGKVRMAAGGDRPAPALAQGADLVAVDAAGEPRTVPLDPERAVRRICAQDGELPPVAWDQYLPGTSPRKVC
ncbi:hypothetical protein [Nonomuraea typhae]|uniref:nSTAND1 domain-containing NTPase n=1 Tax=Nonomuraea typhae TaxID=2603600 RepID=UPI0012FB6638|nr:hypothetical protein [Nonomuraea typhae]